MSDRATIQLEFATDEQVAIAAKFINMLIQSGTALFQSEVKESVSGRVLIITFTGGY